MRLDLQLISKTYSAQNYATKVRIFYLAIAVTAAGSLSTSSVSAGTLNAKEVLETYANNTLANSKIH